MDTLLIIILCLVFSSLFSGLEIAFVSANKLKLELGKSTSRWNSVFIGFFSKNASLFLSSMMLGNNIVLVVYGIYMYDYLGSLFVYQNQFSILFLTTLTASFLLLFFAEGLSKVFFKLYANSILYYLSPLISFLFLILYPFVYVYIELGDLILKKLFRLRLKDTQYRFSPVDIDYFISDFHNHNQEEDAVSQEIQLLQNVIDLKKSKVRDCMVPRNEMIVAEIRSSIEDLKQKFIDSGFSKIIIYRGDLDTVVGYVHAYDLFKSPKRISEVLRPIYSVPVSMMADRLLQYMIENRKSIANVFDEFGGLAGMITLEDLMEEIFGEIHDEFDDDTVVEKKLANGRYVFSARLDIDYLNKTYHFNFPESEQYETLGGLVTHFCQRIPLKNTEFKIENLSVRILQASKTKVDLVMIKVSPNN